MTSEKFQNYLQGRPSAEVVPVKQTDDVEPEVWDLRFPDVARKHVFNYIKERLNPDDPIRETFSVNQVYLVWFTKVLRNWKAVLGTELGDRALYEVTHNGDAHETYIDEYKKFNNVCVPD